VHAQGDDMRLGSKCSREGHPKHKHTRKDGPDGILQCTPHNAAKNCSEIVPHAGRNMQGSVPAATAAVLEQTAQCALPARWRPRWLPGAWQGTRCSVQAHEYGLRLRVASGATCGGRPLRVVGRPRQPCRRPQQRWRPALSRHARRRTGKRPPPPPPPPRSCRAGHDTAAARRCGHTRGSRTAPPARCRTPPTGARGRAPATGRSTELP
jgi:hypothetical protein